MLTDVFSTTYICGAELDEFAPSGAVKTFDREEIDQIAVRCSKPCPVQIYTLTTLAARRSHLALHRSLESRGIEARRDPGHWTTPTSMKEAPLTRPSYSTKPSKRVGPAFSSTLENSQEALPAATTCSTVTSPTDTRA